MEMHASQTEASFESSMDVEVPITSGPFLSQHGYLRLVLPWCRFQTVVRQKHLISNNSSIDRSVLLVIVLPLSAHERCSLVISLSFIST